MLFNGAIVGRAVTNRYLDAMKRINRFIDGILGRWMTGKPVLIS